MNGNNIKLKRQIEFKGGPGSGPRKGQSKKDNINYMDILTPKVKKEISNSVDAAIADGNEEVVLDADRITSLFSETLSSSQYSNFNSNKADDILFDYANKLFKERV